jgi:hypothetical protein
MPLLEIIQTRQITASIRLDEPTAEQIDQYAAFLHAQPMKSWTRRSATSSPRTATSRSSCELRKPLSVAGEPSYPPRAAEWRCSRSLERRPSKPSQQGRWRPAMVRARAANRSAASIPFGAAHRVYFDTPPLKGWKPSA